MASEEIDFTAPSDDRYLKLDPGFTHYLTFVEHLGDHKEFKLGKGKDAKPAPVYKVVDNKGKTYRLSVTSTQLMRSLELVEKALGSFMNRRLKITPEGDGTDRTYKVRAIKDDDATVQASISGA